MSSTVYAHLAWIIPVAMLGLAFLLVMFAVVVDGARRDRRMAYLYRAEAARRAMGHALTPRPVDPSIQRRIDKWN